MQLFIFSAPKLLSSMAVAASVVMQRNDGSPAAACGCLGFFGFFIIALIALNIALLIWVARDAKSRGMDSAVLWMILVMFTGIISLLIYLFSRPQGNVIP